MNSISVYVYTYIYIYYVYIYIYLFIYIYICHVLIFMYIGIIMFDQRGAGESLPTAGGVLYIYKNIYAYT